MQRLEGAYSVTALVDGTLVAFRDPLGFRPLALGRIGEDWVVASETLRARPHRRRGRARRAAGRGRLGRRRRACTPRRRFPPGRTRSASSSTSTSRGPTRASAASRCTARACAWASGSPRRRRSRPTSSSASPTAGRPPRSASRRRSGIPFNEALIKNRYVARTFIQPDQGMREQGIRMKFNPLDEVEGKRIVVVDDSIVRGEHDAPARRRCSSTRAPPRCTCASRRRPSSRRASTGSTWPTRTSSPPPTARSRRCASHIGATSLHYLSVEGMQEATSSPRTRSAAPASRATTRRACRRRPRSSASSPRPPASRPESERARASAAGDRVGRRRAAGDAQVDGQHGLDRADELVWRPQDVPAERAVAERGDAAAARASRRRR